MNSGITVREAAVAGLIRSDPRGPGITRQPAGDGFGYTGPAGAPITDPPP